MKIGIIGMPGSGKTTIFNAITGSSAELSGFQGAKKDPNLAVIRVPDERLDRLSAMYNPKKTTHAKVQYVDVGGGIPKADTKDASTDELLKMLRPMDAMVLVVRNFDLPGLPATPQEDMNAFEADMALTDLITVEKRLERLEKEVTKGKKGDPKELELLRQAQQALNNNQALRTLPEIADSSLLKGYAFLTAKPCILLLNTSDDKELGITPIKPPPGVPLIEIKGRLEMEIAQLAPEDAQIFREELNMLEPATQRLIRTSYELLGLISFFTVGEDEVRAWDIPQNTPAPKAAGAIHSDIERGFIRAEVVAYDDLMAAGSYHAAQKAGKVRLEGKEYIVKDGDVINFRFSV